MMHHPRCYHLPIPNSKTLMTRIIQINADKSSKSVKISEIRVKKKNADAKFVKFVKLVV